MNHTKESTIYRNGILIRAKNTNRFLCIRKTFTSYFTIYLKGNVKRYPLHWLIYRMSEREKTILKNLYGITEESYTYVLESFQLSCSNTKKAYEYHKTHQSIMIYILDTLRGDPSKTQYHYDVTFPKEDRIYPFLMEDFLKRMSKTIFQDDTTTLPKSTFLSKIPLFHEQSTIHGTKIKTHYWIYEIEREFPLTPSSFSITDDIYTRVWVSESFLEKEPHLFPILFLVKTHNE